jgi:hydroxymethylbilane synthase
VNSFDILRIPNLKPIRVGSRGSKLALWQAHWVIEQLSRLDLRCELVIVTTSGDSSAAPLGQIGGQGVFTKELQLRLLADEIDVAVHSLKDLPTHPVQGLCLAAVPHRESTADCLISRQGLAFEDLPSGARIGTGSSRRASQLRAWRKDVEISDIRGNVDSRLRKLDEGQFDAIVLAKAGLSRLQLMARVTQELPPDRVLPAVGQGALGLECRTSDASTQQSLMPLDDPESHAAVLAERQLLNSLQAGCLAPVGALATLTDGVLTLEARVIETGGCRQIDGKLQGRPEDAEKIGQQLARQMLKEGAGEFILAERSRDRSQ